MTTRKQAWAEEKVPWNKTLIDEITPPNINNIFRQIYGKFSNDYLLINHIPEEQVLANPDSGNPYIYIGLKNDNNLFGDYLKQITFNRGESISNTPYNRNCVNKFKLYIMSIISNYKTGDSSLHKLINEEISKGANFDLQKVVGILGMPPIIPVKPPVIAPQVKGPVIASDDMFELQIYREFGIKCSGGKECYNEIADKFYKYNEKEISTRSRDLIREVYVNVFDYITGSDVPLIGKEGAYTSCIKKTYNALRDLNVHLKVFIGARTMAYFNIAKLITIINNIRIEVNKSVNIQSKETIPNI